MILLLFAYSGIGLFLLAVIARHAYRLMALALILVLSLAADASACHRCGIFGRGCHFNSNHVAQQVAYTPPAAASTNFVFNNTFPTPYLLGQQGNSVYGYSLASAPYQLDANLFMDRAARFTELALQSSDDANRAFAANTASAMALNDSADRRTKNTLLALSAIQANSATNGSPQTLSFQATVTNGRLSIKRLDDPGAPPQQFSASAVTSSVCASCHDGKGGPGKGPVDLVLDGSAAITEEQYHKSLLAVIGGKMPPAPRPSLSDPEKAAVAAQLCKLLAR